MKIAVSMITLNEQDYIEAALESCWWADVVCIVDGGSTDGTVDLIKKTRPNAIVKVIPWQNHFGQQRQASLELVPADAAWIVRLDADEKFGESIRGHAKMVLEALPADTDAVRIRQVNLVYDLNTYSSERGGWETWPRMWRNLRLPDGSMAWRWTGQVHEYCQLMTAKGLVNCPDEKIVSWNAPVLHYGWLDRSRREQREALYTQMQGSGFAPGDLVNRSHVAKKMPGVEAVAVEGSPKT